MHLIIQNCVSFSNQECMIEPSPCSLHPNEFAVKLDKFAGSCNTLNDLSIKVCVPNKTEDLNLSLNKAYIIRVEM